MKDRLESNITMLKEKDYKISGLQEMATTTEDKAKKKEKEIDEARMKIDVNKMWMAQQEDEEHTLKVKIEALGFESICLKAEMTTRIKLS